MAKDLPEFKKSVGIQPVAQPLGFAEAAQGQAKAASFIGDLGAAVAQNAATERARRAGIEAGKTTPGIEIPIVLGKADEAFAQSYKMQEYATGLNDASQFLDRLTFESMQNPTPSTLIEYDDAARRGIDDLTSRLSHENGDKLKQELSAGYLSNRYKLEQKIINKGEEYQAANFDKAFNNRLKSMNDLILSGTNESYEEATRIYNSTRDVLESEVINSRFSRASVNERLELLEKTLQDSVNQKHADDLYKDPKALELFLYNLKNQPPTQDNLRKAQVMLSTLNQKHQLSNSFENIYMNEFMTKVNLGQFQPTDILKAADVLSAENFSKLELTLSRDFKKKMEEQNEFAQIKVNKDDAGFLANVSSGVLDKFLEQESATRAATLTAQGTPTDNDLMNKVLTAQDYKVSFQALNNEIEAQLKYGSPEQSIGAAKAVQMFQGNQPAGITKLDKEARSVANIINALRSNTNKSEEEVAAFAKGSVYNLTPEVKEERKIAAERWMNESLGTNLGSYNTNNAKLKEKIRDVMGGHRYFGRNTVVPDGMVTTFRTLMPIYYERTGDRDIALKELAEDVGQVYPETNTNHRPEFMQNAPENVAPELNQGYFLQNSKMYALHKLVEENKALQANPQSFVMNKLEWPEDPFAGKDINEIDLLSKSLVSGNAKIMVDGKLQQIVIKSDLLTKAPSSKIPSWAFYASLKDIEMPLSDSSQFGGIARWFLEPELFDNQLKRIPRKALVEAQRAKDISDNAIGIELLDSDAYWILEMQKKAKKDKELNE